MLGFLGVRAVWAVSALGAPRPLRGHELLWAGFLRGRTRPRTTQRNPPLKRTSLSRVLCERLAQTQRRPESARVALLRMERDGLIVLPPRRSTRVLRPVPRPNRRWAPDRQVRPLRTPAPKKVSSGTPATTSALRRCPARSYGTLSVPRRANRWPCSASAPLHGRPHRGISSSVGSAASAPFVVNNARFLILPWVRIKHLAVLAQVERCLLDDWDRRYALRPALLETFCESLAGTCYRAANPGRQNTGPRQARREKRICAAGQGCKASSTGRRFSIADHHPGSERLRAPAIPAKARTL